MTKINKMVMRGFKSFAKRTEFNFGNNFNCILGPNGSGKSNVLDALCFVLGRGSAKSMRAEKSANLIYNGGKLKKPAKDGEVSIYFDNESKVFPVEEKEIKITRIIKQSGQSVYKINDKKRTRTEMLEMLGKANIDPDGYNIILQGDIIHLIEMPAVERRQIVEEIAGLGVYEDKKQKALRELNRVEDRLNEAEIILKERNAYLKELKKERDQALKYKDAKDKIDESKAAYFHKVIGQKDMEKAKFDSQIEELDKKIKEVDNQITTNKSIIENYRQQLDNISKEIEQKGEKEQVEVHKEIEKLKVTLATDNSKIDNFNNEIQRIKQRVNELNNELKEHSGKTKGLEDKKKDLDKYKKEKNNDLNILETELEKFRKKHDLDNATEIDKEVEEIDLDSDKKQKIVHKFREEQQNILREKDRIEFQIQTMDDRIAKVLEVEKEHKDQIQTLKNRKQLFKQTTLELNKLLNEDSSIGAQLSASRGKLIESQEIYAKLNARNIHVQERNASNVAINKILELKKTKRGIYGTVSELGNVSKKYSLSLEIAAGNKIKHIVVEDERVAADCIKYLKSNRLGVATFIPMNKIRPAISRPEVQKLAKSRGVHGFAQDLITYDKKYEKVFSYVFGNVLVIEDIDTARRLGIGSAKMVTLDGDMADISGAMKGGFRSKKRSGMAFKEKEVVKDLETTEEQVANLQAIISGLQRRRTDNEDKIVKFRKDKAQFEGEIITLEKSLHLDSGDVDATKLQKKELNVQLKDYDKKFDDVMSKLSDVNRELAQNQIKKQQLRSKISQLRNPTLIAQLNTFEQKRTQIKERLIQIDSEIKSVEEQIKIKSPERDKIQSILKQHNKENETFLVSIGEVKKKIAEDQKALKEKEVMAKEFYAKYKKLFTERQQINDSIRKIESKVESYRDISRKTEIKMNTLSLENAKVKAELIGLEEEYKPYKEIPVKTKKSIVELKQDMMKYERMVSNMGAVNMKALEIYDTIETEYNSLLEKKDKLHSEKGSVIKMMDEIELKKKDLFLETLNILDKYFQNIFLTLSTKGQAFLKLENPDNPFEGGLRIMVRLTGTKFMDIRSLSGGEKTMTALAFIFAVQDHNPHSFYVLDEVDAALDKHNSEKLAKLVRKYVDKAQYVVISHNDSVISEADLLYGVSMNEHGVTSVTSLKL